MSGQNKIKVSSEINETFNDIFCDEVSNCASSHYGIKSEKYNPEKILNPEIMDHAYALISLARQNGVEPVDLLAKILNSGNLVLTQKESIIQSEGPSNSLNFAKDPTDIGSFEDDIKDWAL